MRVWRLTSVCLSVCLSVAYIGTKSRTERLRKTKIGTEVAHITRDSDTTFKVKRSKVKVTGPLYSPPCWRVRQLQQWGWNALAVINCCYVLPSARPREALRRPRGRRGAGAYRGGRPPTACLLCHTRMTYMLGSQIPNIWKCWTGPPCDGAWLTHTPLLHVGYHDEFDRCW